jgi:hypothetical protein
MPDGSILHRACHHCHATSTPLWRRTPCRRFSLCNACGLYLKQHKQMRPITAVEPLPGLASCRRPSKVAQGPVRSAHTSASASPRPYDRSAASTSSSSPPSPLQQSIDLDDARVFLDLAMSWSPQERQRWLHLLSGRVCVLSTLIETLDGGAE